MPQKAPEPRVNFYIAIVDDDDDDDDDERMNFNVALA